MILCGAEDWRKFFQRTAKARGRIDYALIPQACQAWPFETACIWTGVLAVGFSALQRRVEKLEEEL